jgi:hypothetical protein
VPGADLLQIALIVIVVALGMRVDQIVRTESVEDGCVAVEHGLIAPILKCFDIVDCYILLQHKDIPSAMPCDRSGYRSKGTPSHNGTNETWRASDLSPKCAPKCTRPASFIGEFDPAGLCGPRRPFILPSAGEGQSKVERSPPPDVDDDGRAAIVPPRVL